MTHLNSLKLAVVAASAALALTACNQAPSVNSEMSFLNADSNIVGGEVVKSTEVFAESTVALATVKFGVFCTGSLVSSNLVVTAAHCADIAKEMDLDDKMVVVFSRSLKEKKLAARVISQAVQHPDWEKTLKRAKDLPADEVIKDHGDVAVVKFEGSIPAGYKPAKILGDASLLENGAEVVIAGYGNLSMIPRVDAFELMKTSVLLTDKDFSTTEVLFAQHEGRGACHGDSGGPAFVKIKDEWVLFGVTSRAAKPAGGLTCLEGSIYTNLAANIDFLKSAAAFLNQTEESEEPAKPVQSRLAGNR